MQRVAAFLLVVLLVVPAAADEKPAKQPLEALTTTEVADRALQAFESHDADALKALAARDAPDPWVVADLLCSRGEHDAAEAFAGAGPRAAVAGLAHYVASRRGKTDDAAARKALYAAIVGIRGADNAAAYEAIEDHEGDGSTVVGISILFHKGLLFRPMRRLEESSALSLRAAAAAERWGWIRMALRAYDSAGIVHRVLKNKKEAIRSYRHALTHAEALEDQAQIATASVNIAYVHHKNTEYPEALGHYERAITLFEKLGQDSDLASGLNNVGRILMTMGDYGQALAHHHHALRLYRKLGMLASVAGEEINIGVVHASLANYAKALEFYELGLRDAEKAGKKRWMFNALNNTASVYWELGNPIKAREYAEQALDLMKAEGHEADAAPVIIGLGMIHAKLKDHERAWTYYEKGLGLARTHGLQRAAANALGNMGKLHLELGQNERALVRYQEAMEIGKSVGDRVATARYSACIGVTAMRMGDREEGMRRLRDAIREARRLRARPLLAWALPELARAHLDGGEASRALYVALDGLRVVEHLLGGLDEDEAATVRSRNAALFAIGTLAAARVDEPAEVVNFLESGRAGSLLEALGGRKAMRWSDLSAELRRAELDAKRQHEEAHAAYARASATGKLEETRTAAEALDAAGRRVGEVADRIRREAKGQAAGLFYPRAATIGEIQGALGKGQALVLYGLCLDEALALVLTRESQSLVALGTATDVTAACEALTMSARETDPGAGLARLRKLLVKPLALPAGVKRVIVSPEGPLCYLPFGALYDKPVALTPSGTTHALLMKEVRAGGTRVLALGDPDYGAGVRPESKVYSRGRPLQALPFTRAEANAIGDEVLLGKHATEAGLRNALRAHERWRSVHFACHGLVDPEKPRLSSLALSRGTDEDGFLTAGEVLRMRIPTDLAVLSACETGKGKVVRGEGILGLTRAFMYAGAPRVICSLWKVDDEATKALMVKFYELWNPKPHALGAIGKGKPLGAAEALREAQAFVRGHDKWKHPYFWAAWVLWGLPD